MKPGLKHKPWRWNDNQTDSENLKEIYFHRGMSFYFKGVTPGAREIKILMISSKILVLSSPEHITL